MFTPPLTMTFFLVTDSIIGLVMGIATGVIAALVLRLRILLRGLVINGVLGALAFTLAFEAVCSIPWRNATTYYVGDTLVTSTENYYQYPDRVAHAATILLPLLHELHRFKRRVQAKS